MEAIICYFCGNLIEGKVHIFRLGDNEREVNFNCCTKCKGVYDI